MLKQHHKLDQGAGVAWMMHSSTTGGASNTGAVLNTGEGDSAGRVGPNPATSKISAGFIWPMSTFSPLGPTSCCPVDGFRSTLRHHSGFATSSLVQESRVISRYRPRLSLSLPLLPVFSMLHVADREYSVPASQSAILRTVSFNWCCVRLGVSHCGATIGTN